MSENSTPTEEEPLHIGDVVLERYRVVEGVAAGGHSLVYRGVDERLSRPVCIKVFHQPKRREGVYKTSYQHFVQEAFALSKLTHPNTLRIYDFGHLPGAGDDEQEQGPPFQVSEFMNHGTLSSKVRSGGTFSVDEAALMLEGLCGALAEAHHHGIIHRDIKPQNILFLQSGDSTTIKLADFGIAKFSGDGSGRYQADDTKLIAGKTLRMFSPTWAAPEQISGDSVGPPCDIYSMALIAAYILTGRPLFACRDAEEAYRIRIDSDAHIDRRLAEFNLPGPLVTLIKRSCQLEPAARPASVDEFAAALASALRQQPVPADTYVPAASYTEQALPLAPPPPDPAQTPAPIRPRAAMLATVSGADVERRPSIRVRRNDIPESVGDRQVQFVATISGAAALDAALLRVKFSLMPVGDRLVADIKPLTCFVAEAGKRPSPAVQLDHNAFVDFVLPNQKPIARARVSFGRSAAGHTVFALDNVDIALATEEYGSVVALDFGPGAQCFFVFTKSGAQAQTNPEKAQKRRG